MRIHILFLYSIKKVLVVVYTLKKNAVQQSGGSVSGSGSSRGSIDCRVMVLGLVVVMVVIIVAVVVIEVVLVTSGRNMKKTIECIGVHCSVQ